MIGSGIYLGAGRSARRFVRWVCAPRLEKEPYYVVHAGPADVVRVSALDDGGDGDGGVAAICVGGWTAKAARAAAYASFHPRS